MLEYDTLGDDLSLFTSTRNEKGSQMDGWGKVGPINLFRRVNLHGHVSLSRAHEQTLSCRCRRDLLDNLGKRRKVVECQVDDHTVLATKVNQ